MKRAIPITAMVLLTLLVTGVFPVLARHSQDEYQDSSRYESQQQKKNQKDQQQEERQHQEDQKRQQREQQGDQQQQGQQQGQQQQGQGYTVSPMEDVVDSLKQSTRRSARLKKDAPYSLPMADIGKYSPNGIKPELIDMNGDGMSDLVFSFTNGLERFQGVLLNTGKGFEAVYTCGYTNANDMSGQFTYRGDCAEIR